jgi:hypothetical protein
MSDRWALITPELFEGLTLIVAGAAVISGRVRGIDTTLPGDAVASVLLIAAGGVMIGGKAAWPESERTVMWIWIGLLAPAVLVYTATNW